MKLIPGFDPERQLVIIKLTTNLLNKYYPNFLGLINKCKNTLPKGLKIEKGIESNMVSIIFPIDPKEANPKVVDENSKLMQMSLDRDKVSGIFDIVNNFINLALKKELSLTEFIPLGDYPLEDLKTDVKNAIQNKRNFCVVKDYSTYKDLQNNVYNFEQYNVEYGTSEYCDIALEIINSADLTELQEKYIPKLKKVEWY